MNANQFSLRTAMVATVCVAILCAAWVVSGQSEELRRLKREFARRELEREVAFSEYLLRCLLEDDIVGKEIRLQPDIALLCSLKREGINCRDFHLRLMTPDAIEETVPSTGRHITLMRKGEFWRSESRENDELYQRKDNRHERRFLSWWIRHLRS